MGRLIGPLRGEYYYTARAEGFFEQNEAVVCELDNPFQRDAAKPARLERVSLVKKDLGRKKEAGTAIILEQSGRLFHELLSNLLCSAASPRRVADHQVELT